MLVSDLPIGFVLATAFVLGALWGSFFNVAIHRWPRDMSVVSPPSHCPACGKPIPGWRNVPIVAYLVQRGKAACCGAPMTPRYVVVEVLSAVLAVALGQRYVVEAGAHASLESAAIDAALWFVFVGGLVIATFVDLEWMEIPDEVSIGGTAVGLATVSLRTGVSAADAALGAGAAFLVVQIFLVWGWERFSGKRGMGEGDSKLLMMIGSFLGWRGALFALVAGAMQGVIAYVVARATGARTAPTPPAEGSAHDHDHERGSVGDDDEAKPESKDEPAGAGEEPEDDDDEPADEPGASQRIPFGPFLALGALEFLFFGESLVSWYFRQFE